MNEQVTHSVWRDGRRIAFHETPGCLPVVVLDAGGGLDSTHWDALVAPLAERTGSRILTYDRAGFGSSDAVEGPWDVWAATADLAQGLETLAATKDVILVSHSLAGAIAFCLAQQHPDWLSGAILVDANVPDFFTNDTVVALSAAMAPAVAAAAAAPLSQQSRQLLAVAESFTETSRAFHRMQWPRGIPVTVIVSETTPFDDVVAARWWVEAQKKFASGAANRKLIVADRSSHDIAVDRPDVVIQAIEDQMSSMRGGARSTRSSRAD